MKKTRYRVALPDGGVDYRDSETRHTHAIAVREDGAWRVLAFCRSGEIAELRLATQQKLWPDRPIVLLPTVAEVILTDLQRTFLLEIGERTIEILGTSHVFALVRRGLLERRSIGQRCWKVRRTRDGRRAVGAPEPELTRGGSAGPMGGPGATRP